MACTSTRSTRRTKLPIRSGFSRTTTNPSYDGLRHTWLSGDPRNGSFAADQSISRTRATERASIRRSAAALGLLAKTGSGWTFLDPNFPRARQQRWRLDLQRQFGDEMVVSVAYAGMYANHVRLHEKAGLLFPPNTGRTETPATTPSPPI